MSPQQAYDELTKLYYNAALIGSCEAVLGWDERTYMPRGGSQHRSEQLGLLAGLHHEGTTSPRIGELLSELETSDLAKEETSPEAVNIREFRHWYDKMTKLPKDLVEEITRVTTLAQGEWVTARKNSDFKAFLPWLEKVIALKIKQAEAYGYEGEPYNALLDDYEPGATTDDIDAVFGGLRDELVELLGAIKDSARKPDPGIVNRKFDVDQQRKFGEMVAKQMGFSFEEGRLDVTTHPFCSGMGPGDTRITTRYNPNRLNDALFGTMHEAGHALYEMGIDKKTYYGTPMGSSVSLGIHESQSRMWENQVGRSLDFWKHFFPKAQEMFKSSLSGVKLEDFYGAINNVAPSHIRVEADEATYNLHIMLRYEMERALMKGDLKPADAAGEWNNLFEKYFGMKVDKDSNGVLQDVHWSAGLLGYFPTYSLGNLYSAQFFNKAKADIPDLHEQFARGELLPLREWLRDNIHLNAGRYRATKLVEVVTGESLSYKPLIAYMKEKFSGMYDI